MMMVPSPTLFSAPFQKDKPAEVDRPEQSLQTAKGELEKAGTEWGGHRVQAIKHIDAARKELEQAEAWARQHHEIKGGPSASRVGTSVRRTGGSTRTVKEGAGPACSRGGRNRCQSLCRCTLG